MVTPMMSSLITTVPPRVTVADARISYRRGLASVARWRSHVRDMSRWVERRSPLGCRFGCVTERPGVGVAVVVVVVIAVATLVESRSGRDAGGTSVPAWVAVRVMLGVALPSRYRSARGSPSGW
jgi:hypothetical protein